MLKTTLFCSALLTLAGSCATTTVSQELSQGGLPVVDVAGEPSKIGCELHSQQLRVRVTRVLFEGNTMTEISAMEVEQEPDVLIDKYDLGNVAVNFGNQEVYLNDANGYKVLLPGDHLVNGLKLAVHIWDTQGKQVAFLEVPPIVL
jgi:hypothetical protein